MWLTIVIIAQFINAIVFLCDKYLLGGGRIGKPAVYAFYVGILGIFALVLIPFGGLVFPGVNQLLIDLLAGAVYILACLIFYQTLKQNEASRVVPVVGSFIAVFTLILSALFLGEQLTPKFISAFSLLLVGSILISIRLNIRINAEKVRIDADNISVNQRSNPRKSASSQCNFLLTVLASFIFSVFYILTKYIYLHQPFISGFIWSRFGGVIAALILLTLPAVHRTIFKSPIKILSQGQPSLSWRKSTPVLFLSNQLMSGINFILINWAVSLASVALVSALQGVQYVFIFLISLFLARYPRVLTEEISRSIIIQKIIAILLIGIGIFLINR